MAAIGSLAWQLETADPTRDVLTRAVVEFAYDELDRFREDLGPLLTLPAFRPLARGLDGTLAALYAELGRFAPPRRGAHL